MKVVEPEKAAGGAETDFALVLTCESFKRRSYRAKGRSGTPPTPES
jgi:hypothetical protein